MCSFEKQRFGPCRAFQSCMLRIIAIRDEEVLRIKLEGRLTGPGIEELRTVALRHTPFAAIDLDITAVEFVDRSGNELLVWLYRVGVKFRMVSDRFSGRGVFRPRT